jgi:hypothetical protein
MHQLMQHMDNGVPVCVFLPTVIAKRTFINSMAV